MKMRQKENKKKADEEGDDEGLTQSVVSCLREQRSHGLLC